jgi:hypothetical protein
MTLPGTEPWNPSRHTTAEAFVFTSKGSPQGWFFIRDYEQVETQPNERAILKHARIFKNQTLAQNDGHDGYAHWVSHPAIKSGDNEITRGIDRRRSAYTLYRKTGK